MNRVDVFWKTASLSVKIIALNVLVFLSMKLLGMIGFLTNLGPWEQVMYAWLALPADPMALLIKPWTLLTHMFVHQGLLHLIFNMITLFFAARLFEQYFDDARFFGLYFLSGLGGIVVFLLAYQLFPALKGQTGATAVGASACIYGVLMAICAYRPDERVRLWGILEIKLFWLGFLLVALNFINYTSNVGGYLAHFGGIATGLLFTMQHKKFKDITAWLHPVYRWLTRTPGPRRKSKLKVVKSKSLDRLEDWQYADERAKQAKIDEILDKISKSGYSSLSKEEKKILFEISKKI